MSHTSVTLGPALPAKSGPSRLFAAISAMGERFMAAQQARADRFVRPYLAQMSNTELTRLGFSEIDISEIRKWRHVPVVRWV